MASTGGVDVRVVIDPVKLAELMRSPQGPVMRELFEAGELVKQEAQRRVGVHRPDPWGRPKDRRPGTLRDSIVKRVVDTGGQPSVQVGSSDPIALLHHEGTKSHVIVPRTKPLLVFFSRTGAVVYAKRVNHPGTRPNRYLTEALQVLRGRY